MVRQRFVPVSPLIIAVVSAVAPDAHIAIEPQDMPVAAIAAVSGAKAAAIDTPAVNITPPDPRAPTTIPAMPALLIWPEGSARVTGTALIPPTPKGLQASEQ
jgi:hypothetical protein